MAVTSALDSVTSWCHVCDNFQRLIATVYAKQRIMVCKKNTSTCL